MSGVATISQVGTTTNEVLCAAITLSGLFFLLLFVKSSNANISAKYRLVFLIAAGALFGTSAGLKLTAAIYAPGAALVSILAAGNLKQRIHHFACFSGAWWLAFLLLWGPWGLSNYRLTGNPFFPNARKIFPGPWPAEIGDPPLFLPHGILETLFYPFYWANNSRLTVTEISFSDPRFAIVYVFVFLALLTYLPFSIARGRPIISQSSSFRVTEALLAFFVISYVSWLCVTPQLRYAATIESLLGIIIITSLYRLYTYYKLRFDAYAASSVVVILTIIAFTFTTYTDWGRVNYGRSVFEISAPQLSNNSLVLFVDQPIAYLSPFLSSGHDVTFIGLTHTVLAYAKNTEYTLGQLVENKIREWNGPIYYVAMIPFGSETKATLSQFGLYTGGSCATVKSNIDSVRYICAASKTEDEFVTPAPAFTITPYIKIGDRILTDSAHDEWGGYASSGWSTPEPWATWTEAENAEIVLRLAEPVSHDLIFSFNACPFVAPNHKRLVVKISANDTSLKTLDYVYDLNGDCDTVDVDIPRDVINDSNPEIRIGFSFSALASPQQLGINEDTRQLGIAMRWFTLVERR